MVKIQFLLFRRPVFVVLADPFATFDKPVVTFAEGNDDCQHDDQNETDTGPKVNVLFVARFG